ncbi:putative glycosyltransferase EpsF [Botrimarina colliarenosi]|uniref:Putative glycosyltransferase EpsF n=1 Tax=Botrimarina colliarenosi TaxID=2528001 RepID=A0A5C6A405_9BACT|nr:putative glycosyltransferase EpsF [Botrimarina colliarenosi]
MRVLFVQTSMPVGGAETLLVNLVRRLDPTRFAPEVVCLKERGPLGDTLAEEGFPVHYGLLKGKYDLRVLPRLTELMRRRKIDAVVTVGAGDKMFWGRLAARCAGVPVVAAALHSTGWPDGVGRLNRLQTPLTDAFIAVAEPHGRFLVEFERFPDSKVRVIPNGVDVERFAPPQGSMAIREELGVGPTTPLVGILAALRPEKNHELFVAAASRIRHAVPEAQFVVIGEGPERRSIEEAATLLGLYDPTNPQGSALKLLGNRDDVPSVLAALDVLTLTSHNEANPVSILEGMSCGLPVVATNVGSVSESVIEGQTGWLVPPGDKKLLAERVTDLLNEPLLAKRMGEAGRRRVVERSSLGVMVGGYERLIAEIYEQKTGRRVAAAPQQATPQQAAAEMQARTSDAALSY